MEQADAIERFSEFFSEFYKDELVQSVAEGNESFAVDYSLLDKFDIELSDYMLEQSEEAIAAAQESIGQIDTGLTEAKIIARFFNLPESRKIRIRNVRSKHINKLIEVDGIVKRASEIRPEVSEAVFVCPDCGANITIIQGERAMQTPSRCECGNKRGFKMINQKLYDTRWIAIEEPFEITTGERPSEIMVFLKEDLTSLKMRNRTDPGNRIKVVGILKQLPRRSKGKASRQLEIYVDSNYIEGVEIEWEDLEITPEDEEKIIELSKDPLVFEKLKDSLAPSMYGLDYIKKSIILQLFGGVPRLLPDRTKVRGSIHILLIGDPASGKSQLMQLTSKLMPRGKYVSGTGVTGPGLTASVVRDEQFLGGWVLEAGALVMANKSLCAIDEFSKVDPQDRVALQEAMSLQTISIAKASIVATLPAQTSILAGGNPKLGRFDPYLPIREQVDIDEVLLSRFDLRFALRDVPNPEVDAKMTEHILRMRRFEEDAHPLLSPEFIRKYIAYARSHIQPQLTKDAGEKIGEFYLEMRKKAGEEAPVAITLRQYEALIRLSEASAKIRLSDKIEEEDVIRAINLMKISLREFGFEPETGMFDIDRAEGQPVTAAQRSKIRVMLDVIDALEAEQGVEINREDIIRRGIEEGVTNAEDILNKMLREGMLSAPRPGKISKV